MRSASSVAAGAAFAFGAAWSAPAAAPVVPALADVFGIQRRLDCAGVALTFDDGPHPQGTPAALELLDRAGAVATFFLVGEQVRRWPSIASDIAAAGHEIALHGDVHRLLLRRSPRALAADLDRAADTIHAATGRVARWYRPPYGVFSLGGLEVARRRWLPLLWSRWGRDWERRATPASIARRATAGIASGDVVLLHDADHYSVAESWRKTIAALPFVLERVEAAELRCVAITHST